MPGYRPFSSSGSVLQECMMGIPLAPCSLLFLTWDRQPPQSNTKPSICYCSVAFFKPSSQPAPRHRDNVSDKAASPRLNVTCITDTFRVFHTDEKRRLVAVQVTVHGKGLGLLEECKKSEQPTSRPGCRPLGGQTETQSRLAERMPPSPIRPTFTAHGSRDWTGSGAYSSRQRCTPVPPIGHHSVIDCKQLATSGFRLVSMGL